MTFEIRHRGSHPEDAGLFAEPERARLRQALSDYCWLLSRGYAVPSSLKLVGDRYRLVDRQRLLLMRSACSDQQREYRRQSQISPPAIVGEILYIDGFNVLIALESALSGSWIFIGQDGCYRDLSSVHGTYRRVQETQAAIELVGRTLATLQVERAVWFLDQPVSNSGRLKSQLTVTAQQQGWPWTVELCPSPDHELKQIDGIVVSTDSVILDAARRWFSLNQIAIDTGVPDARVIDLRQAGD